jgi:hypothetical protein
VGEPSKRRGTHQFKSTPAYIVGAGGHSRFEVPVRHRRYEQPGQNAKDGDHDQQLDQGESLFDVPISRHHHFDSSP